MSIIKLHEQEENNELQETVKSIIEDIKELAFKPDELSGGDIDVLADLLTDNVEWLIKALGLTGLSITTNDKQESEENTLKAQIQDLYSLNDSMIAADPNHIPRYTDGTIIRPADLADMNMNALDNIAEIIGFDLEE